jgi:hypothetical protein
MLHLISTVDKTQSTTPDAGRGCGASVLFTEGLDYYRLERFPAIGSSPLPLRQR